MSSQTVSWRRAWRGIAWRGSGWDSRSIRGPARRCKRPPRRTIARTATMATTRVRVALKVYGEPLAVETDAPAGEARLDEILPVFRKVDDAVIVRAIARVEANGEQVSCSKGCSACCRAQPVPITPPEAAAISRLVDSLPEPRQAEVR